MAPISWFFVSLFILYCELLVMAATPMPNATMSNVNNIASDLSPKQLELNLTPLPSLHKNTSVDLFLKNRCFSLDRMGSTGIWMLLTNKLKEESSYNTHTRRVLRDIANTTITQTRDAQFVKSMSYGNYLLPLILWQLVLILSLTQTITWLLKPLHQPKVLSQVLSGILIGPFVFGRIFPKATAFLFPVTAASNLENYGTLGVFLYLFLTAVDFDINILSSVNRNSIVLALVTTIPPFSMPFLINSVIPITPSQGINEYTFLFFFGFVVCVTSFPVLTRLLAELKFYNKDLGRLVLPAALIKDLFAWIILAFTMLLPESKKGVSSLSLLLPVFAILYIAFCCLILRPLMCWVVRRTPEGEQLRNFHLGMVLAGMMLSGVLANLMGFDAILGIFVYGLVVPKGPLSVTLLDRLEVVVQDLLMPVFFVQLGMDMDIGAFLGDGIEQSFTFLVMLMVMLLSTLAKAVAGLIVSKIFSMITFESWIVGLLMSTKGPLELIVLNIAFQKKIFNNRTFTLLVMNAVVMTCIVTTISSKTLRPSHFRTTYKRRDLQHMHPDSELRVISCIYTSRNVPSMLTLLHISNPTKRSPIFVFPLHLIQLTGRTSNMLIVHETTNKSGNIAKSCNITATRQSDQIIAAFRNYELHSVGIAVRPLTALSPYSTIHEDILAVAEEQHATLIIIPFHKTRSPTGECEELNPAVRSVNQAVLKSPPCTVGILVSGVVSGATKLMTNPASFAIENYHIAMLFFSGPDDREALAYGCRMVKHQAISLTVVRFLLSPKASSSVETTNLTSQSSENMSLDSVSTKERTIVVEDDMQRVIDDEYINQFRLQHISNEAVLYMEKIMSEGGDLVTTLKAMNGLHSMYLVGKKPGGELGTVLAEFLEWSEYPELGPIGDLLASSDLGPAKASVLVMQQYAGENSEMLSQAGFQSAKRTMGRGSVSSTT